MSLRFYLFVIDVVKTMICRIVAKVEFLQVSLHVGIDVVTPNIVEQRVCIRKAELSVVTVLGLDLTIMEIVHEKL